MKGALEVTGMGQVLRVEECMHSAPKGQCSG